MNLLGSQKEMKLIMKTHITPEESKALNIWELIHHKAQSENLSIWKMILSIIKVEKLK